MEWPTRYQMEAAIAKAQLKEDHAGIAYLRIGLAYARERGARLTADEVQQLVANDTALYDAILNIADAYIDDQPEEEDG